ncbi:MAG: hypothetical protein E6J03_10745 [Chloroflexi bacterium]|nr:MAG: hypothetical protein E6J03_10745 [Chloroflexota bacterium]
MSRAVCRRRPAAPLVLAITLGAAVASVVTSSPAAIVGTRPPVTGAVTVDRRAATRPVVAVPAPPPAAAVAGTADPSAFYVLYATSAQGAGPAHAVRLSRPGPVTATGGALPAGADLVRAGDSLWVAGGVRLVRVDLRTGTVTATVPVDGDVTSLAADPAGHRLYAAAGAAGGTTVSERDAGAGTLLASRPLAPGAGHVAATAAGVWVWQEQAGPPAMIRLRPSDLRTVAAVDAMSGPGPLRGGMAGSALWVGDPTSLSCADPLTGRVRATWAAPTPQRVLAADPVRVALLAAGRVLVFPADPRCG